MESIAKDLNLYMSDFEWEIVNNFDLRNVPREMALQKIDRVSFLKKGGSLPSNGAIGCALAHRYCYERTINEGFDHALILEDDVKVSSVNLAAAIAAVKRLSDFDIISFYSKDAVVLRKIAEKVGKYNIHKSLYYCHGAHAYVVSRAGARKLLEAQSPKIRWFSDWPIHAWCMKIYLMAPSTIVMTNRPTSVQTCGPDTHGRSYLIFFVYHLRRIIWKFIGLVRRGLFDDLRVREQ